MTKSRAARSAAALALRWHSGTGALVAITGALTLIGALPALSVLGGSAGWPSLTLALANTPTMLRDWGGRGVVWTQLQQVAVNQLRGILGGAALLVLAIGALTLLALHLARTATRSGDVIVARSVGASRRTVFNALLLEAGALTAVALCVGMVASGALAWWMRTAWPGAVGPANVLYVVAATLGVCAIMLAAPLLMVRALTTDRLVNDDRRPLTLVIPALQLGAALVVLAGGITMQRATDRYGATVTASADAQLRLRELRVDGDTRLARAHRFASFIAAQEAMPLNERISIASSGAHRGLGTIGNVLADCAPRCAPGVAVRGRAETVVHHAVSGDSFAIAGLALRAGRTFTVRDDWNAPLVAVVSARVAREFFPDGDAIGRRMQLDLLNNAWFEVVGVVDDATPRGFGGVVQPPFAVYVSVLQQPVAQVELATRSVLPIAPDALAKLDLNVGTFAAMRDVLAREAGVLGWFTRVLTVMGGIAVLIALGGLLSMLTLWLQSQRTELGIRRAVGARKRDVHRLVLGQASRVAIGGTLFGAWLGQIGWDVLPRIVPGAPGWDGAVVAAVAAGLCAITLGAAFVLSRRFLGQPVGSLLHVDG
jgi:putative ABC transport system permease protein